MNLRLAFLTALLLTFTSSHAADLHAGVAKIEITDRAGLVNDPLFAKALVVKNDSTTVVLITIDAVAIGEIGRVGWDPLESTCRHASLSIL